MDYSRPSQRVPFIVGTLGYSPRKSIRTTYPRWVARNPSLKLSA